MGLRLAEISGQASPGHAHNLISPNMKITNITINRIVL